MQLPCPWCGRRDEAEFRWGGAADVVRTGPPEAVSEDEWADYLFRHDQVAGWQAERWYHVYGCRQWFQLWRHSVTHALGPAAPVTAPLSPKPEA